MRDKILFAIIMMGIFASFTAGWLMGKSIKSKDYRTISYISIEYRKADSTWTIVPRTVVTNRSKYVATMMADSIMIAQTLRIDSAMQAGNNIRVGGDSSRKGIHIENVNIP